MGLNGAVSASIGLVALVAAALLWFVGDHFQRLTVLLVMVASAGLVGTPLGRLMRSVVDWADQGTSQLETRWFGSAVGGLIAAVALYVVAVHLKKNQVSAWTLAAAAVVPIAVVTIPGPLGAAALTVVTAVVSVVAWPIGQGLGIA